METQQNETEVNQEITSSPEKPLRLLCRDCGQCHAELSDHGDLCKENHRLKVEEDRMYRVAKANEHGQLTDRTRFIAERQQWSDPVLEAQNQGAWNRLRNNEAVSNMRNLFLWGPTGTGKSYLAKCLLIHLCRMGSWVHEISARRFIRESQRFEHGDELLDDLGAVKILLLDDLDKIEFTQRNINLLWQLLDDRIEKHPVFIGCGYLTIITSNLSPAALYQAMVAAAPENVATVQALFERTLPREDIEMTGASLRREQERTAK